jgi:putative ABC transport system substrate-binding protein
MNTLASFLLSLLLLFPDSICSADTETPASAKRIVILQSVEHPALTETRKGIEDVVKAKGIKVDFATAQGNLSLAAQIAQKFVSTAPNAFIGIGTHSAQALIAARSNRAIPIIFSSVTDPLAAKLVQTLKTPEGNITGVSNYVDPGVQFTLFKKILPHLTTIGVLYNPGEANSVALKVAMDRLANQQGLKIVYAPANTSAEVAQATQSLLGKVEALFINNDNTALSAFESIIRIANTTKTPVFCSDTHFVAQGALAALGPNQYEIGRQTGEAVLEILNGHSGPFPIRFGNKEELYLNSKMARQLGITFPKELIEQAKKVIS